MHASAEAAHTRLRFDRLRAALVKDRSLVKHDSVGRVADRPGDRLQTASSDDFNRRFREANALMLSSNVIRRSNQATFAHDLA